MTAEFTFMLQTMPEHSEDTHAADKADEYTTD